MNFDHDGIAVRGTYPISTVEIAGYEEGGRPMPMVESAVCDICGGWATSLWVAGEATRLAEDDILNGRISRRVSVLVYACSEHSQAISEALVDEYGSASNRYEADALALKVDAFDRAQFQAGG